MRAMILLYALIICVTVLIIGWSIGAYIIGPFLIDKLKHERNAAEAFYTKQCIDGIQYLQFLNAAVVQVDANGKPITCSN